MDTNTVDNALDTHAVPGPSVGSEHAVLRPSKALFESIMLALEQFTSGFPWDLGNSLPDDCTESEALRHVGIEELRASMQRSGHHHHTKDKRNIRLQDQRVMEISKLVCEHLVSSGMTNAARLSGKMAYPPKGWMGWHTNSDQPGWRLYVNFVKAGGGSRFSWWNGENIESDCDTAGLNFRLFRVTAEPDPFWHCVYSQEWRLSLGFLLDEIADFALESALHAGVARPA